MPTSVRSWPGLARGGPARSMRSVATGSSSSRCGRRRARHRRDAAQRLARHPQRRLLRADVAAVEREHEQRPAGARERGEQLQGAGGHRSALHAAARGRREREALQVQHPAPQRGARLAARARLQHEHGRQRPRRVDSAASSAARASTSRAAAPRGGGCGEMRAGAGARACVATSACAAWPACAASPATFTCRATARTSAATLTASRRTRRVVIRSLSSPRGRSVSLVRVSRGVVCS